MKTSKELTVELDGRMNGRASAHQSASMVIKFALPILAATAAIFTALGAQALTGWHIGGLAVAISVCLCGIAIIVLDKNASTEFAVARTAIDRLRDAEDHVKSMEQHELQQRRANELLTANNSMSLGLENLSVTPNRSPEEVAELFLKVAGPPLVNAMWFMPTEYMTICVYRAEKAGDGSVTLRCKAHNRTKSCDLKDAREYPAGVGLIGQAYSEGIEKTAVDLTAEGMGQLPSHLTKAHDSERYKSMVAVPIRGGEGGKPWGVATATSGRVGHFRVQKGQGIQASESVRVLAGMMSVAVSICASRPHGPGPAV